MERFVNYKRPSHHGTDPQTPLFINFPFLFYPKPPDESMEQKYIHQKEIFQCWAQQRS